MVSVSVAWCCVCAFPRMLSLGLVLVSVVPFPLDSPSLFLLLALLEVTVA